ncbi:MAG: flagellar basal body L-ring protein FlgH [Spongiibacteraceae bacterium]|jgi:flagellar L-ring protein precursor FlgH|nr:flagellar basal body L-ring protein FlgH [Spongiibacteraceae bacterium]
MGRSPGLLIAMVLLALAGCRSLDYELGLPRPGDAEWAPTVVEHSDTSEDGSLFAESQVFALFQDRRAYRAGDILTVILAERTQSSKRADTAIDKSAGIELGVPVLGDRRFEDFSASVSGSRDFSGGARASQQNSLAGYITVTVDEVLPNGSLSVRGEKWIRLNHGDEYIRLKGLVRVDDIDVHNRISSQRIANAEITYAGRGSLAEATQPGWLSRFFNSPLFPF